MLWLKIYRLVALSALLVIFIVPPVLGSNLIYKSYVVRYDRGWDILCEPYVVKKGDWILKIFRQKGEIAHQDFRDFTGIFQRLNPHVKDLNMIRVGQSIDIPLRKLEPGELPGQASGVVTIPFVSLSKVSDIIKKHITTHKIRRGDTISQLVTKHFGGRYGSKVYMEGIKLLQAANPQIENLDQIYAGQKIYLPDPSIREKQWYDALYDEKGNLRESINEDKPGTVRKPEAGPASPLAIVPRPEPVEAPQSLLGQAAATVGGKLMDKGTYYVPRDAGQDFEIDLSKNPLMEVQSTKMLFTQSGNVMNETPEAVASMWPEAKVIQYDENGSVQQVVASIFGAMDEGVTTDMDVGFEDRGTYVTVRAKWVKNESDNRQLCIIPINSPDEQTPEPFRRYMEQNGIILKEILPGGQAVEPDVDTNSHRHIVKNILAIPTGQQKEFVKRLARELKFTFATDIAVKFPYAGIQIEAFANLLATPAGNEVLVDFGDLYGDAIKAIEKSGLQVLQIKAGDSYAAIINQLLTHLGENFVENPSFSVAQRSTEYNTTITVSGFLYMDGQNHRTLMSAATLHPAVSDLLSTKGIAMVTW